MPLPFKIISDKLIEDYTLEEFQEGQVLLVDKPLEWTSFQAVNKIKYFILKKFGIKKIKIGHAGTLDPLATGLLIVCTGKKTKAIPSFQDQFKVYTGTFFIGKTTPSFDLETEPEGEYDTAHVNETLIRQTAQKLIGEIVQIPPKFSAVKINGERAYKKARKGEGFEVPQRWVHIHQFDIVAFDFPLVEFRVKCSKGTYIRTLANDFGKLLNSGAYLKRLRRVAIGEYQID